MRIRSARLARAVGANSGWPADIAVANRCSACGEEVAQVERGRTCCQEIVRSERGFIGLPCASQVDRTLEDIFFETASERATSDLQRWRRSRWIQVDLQWLA